LSLANIAGVIVLPEGFPKTNGKTPAPIDIETLAAETKTFCIPPKSHRIHVWYIYLHLPYKSTIHVGKYTSPMDRVSDASTV